MNSEKNSLDIYKRQIPFSTDLTSVRNELRERRKRFLGSHISLANIVCRDSDSNDALLLELIDYLATRTIGFWNNHSIDAELFCQKFYEVAIACIVSGPVGNESVDDIIQMADCLVRSQDTFILVAKKLLPENRIGELFEFTDMFSSIKPDVNFGDAVLGAVSVFLGVISDPLKNSAKTEEA